MVNFKPIEDFTFDDCVKSLDRHRAYGTMADEELIERYNSLLNSLMAEEKKDYSSAKTFAGLERYIKKFSNLDSASRYKPQYLNQAKHELEALKQRHRVKKIIKVVSCVIVAIGSLIGIFFIGYKPISYFYVSDYSISLSKGACIDTIDLSTNAPYIDISQNISWLKTSKDGTSIIVNATRNTEASREDNFYIYAYPTFFGERIDFMRETLAIHVEQEDGYASYINTNKDDIHFDPEGGEEYVIVQTDGNQWNVESPSEGWLSVTKDGSRAEIKVYENTNKSSRSSSIRIFSDTQEKYINVYQDVYAQDAGISGISMNDGTGNIDMKLRVDYYTQGYSDEDMYVVIKIYSDNNNNVWYRNYEKIYPTQSRSDGSRTFTVRPSVWHGKYGDNTINACISRYTDGNSPLCSFEVGFNVRSNR